MNDRPLDPAQPSTLNGPRRALDTRQVLAVRAAIAGGARPADLALEYDVSVRTIYRYATLPPRSLVAVELDGFRANFRLELGKAPLQVSSWKRAPR